jgi:hypothetical protein
MKSALRDSEERLDDTPVPHPGDGVRQSFVLPNADIVPRAWWST